MFGSCGNEGEGGGGGGRRPTGGDRSNKVRSTVEWLEIEGERMMERRIKFCWN